MEFPFALETVLPFGPGPISTVTSPKFNEAKSDQMIRIIDSLGMASAKAQGLKKPITFHSKCLTNDALSRLYIAHGTSSTGNLVIYGFLKTGEKQLFLFNDHGVIHSVAPTCVLDFYVHESCRRTGYGRSIFEAMLAAENLYPQQLAYDRPSEKFMSFLARHYNLREFTPQANKFVVFKEYYSDINPKDSDSSSISSSNSTLSDDTPPGASSPTSSLGSTPPSTSPISKTPSIEHLRKHREYSQRALWGSNPLLGGTVDDEVAATPRKRWTRELLFGN